MKNLFIVVIFSIVLLLPTNLMAEKKAPEYPKDELTVEGRDWINNNFPMPEENGRRLWKDREHTELTKVQAKEIVRNWLKERDESITRRCKVSFDYILSSVIQETPLVEEGDMWKLYARVCGNITSFWINKYTHKVECYIEYFGKTRQGEKICGAPSPIAPLPPEIQPGPQTTGY